MFKEIKYLCKVYPRFHIHTIVDTEFSEDIQLGNKELLDNFRLFLVAQIIQQYMARNLPVANNVARFYRKHYKNTDSFKLEQDRGWLDVFYPHFEYGKKYYPCVVNNFQKLQYLSL